jgi:hypothetical protein
MKCSICGLPFSEKSQVVRACVGRVESPKHFEIAWVDHDLNMDMHTSCFVKALQDEPVEAVAQPAETEQHGAVTRNDDALAFFD